MHASSASINLQFAYYYTMEGGFSTTENYIVSDSTHILVKFCYDSFQSLAQLEIELFQGYTPPFPLPSKQAATMPPILIEESFPSISQCLAAAIYLPPLSSPPTSPSPCTRGRDKSAEFNSSFLNLLNSNLTAKQKWTGYHKKFGNGCGKKCIKLRLAFCKSFGHEFKEFEELRCKHSYSLLGSRSRCTSDHIEEKKYGLGSDEISNLFKSEAYTQNSINLIYY